MQETRSTCPYCGTGCGVLIESDGARITGVRGDPAHPANHGRLCTKGSTLHLTASPALARQTRLLQPALRTTRGAAPRDISWDAALDLAAGRLASIVQEHGPDAVGLYVSGQLLTEDYYVFNKLAKGLIGTNNIDTNSRLCMSSAVAGYKATLGADAPPACYEDVDHAVVVGVRLGAEHGDLVEVGRDPEQLFQRAHAGHAVAHHHQPGFLHCAPASVRKAKRRHPHCAAAACARVDAFVPGAAAPRCALPPWPAMATHGMKQAACQGAQPCGGAVLGAAARRPSHGGASHASRRCARYRERAIRCLNRMEVLWRFVSNATNRGTTSHRVLQ